MVPCLLKKFLVFTLKRCITRFSACSKILNRRNRRSGFQAFSVSPPLLLLLVSSLDSRARHAFSSRLRLLASPKKNAKHWKKTQKWSLISSLHNVIFKNRIWFRVEALENGSVFYVFQYHTKKVNEKHERKNEFWKLRWQLRFHNREEKRKTGT